MVSVLPPKPLESTPMLPLFARPVVVLTAAPLYSCKLLLAAIVVRPVSELLLLGLVRNQPL